MSVPKPMLFRYPFIPKPAKVYAVVSYDLLEYCQPMFVHEVYATREAADMNCPDSDDFNDYTVVEWEVKQ